MSKGARALAIWLTLAALGSSCTDMSSPAELSHAQILAVRADPPVVGPGQESILEVLVAGPSGVLHPDVLRWGANVTMDGTGAARFVAPAEVPDGGALCQIDVEVEIGGELLLASKKVGVDVPFPAENPVIVDVLADGEPILDDRLTLAPATSVLLDVHVSPPATDAAIHAWYSTVGEIDLYRRSPTELLAPEEPAAGTLITVYRDGLGVAWRTLSVTAIR